MSGHTAVVPPLLVLPVENQVRELDAKLFLAAAAAEHGVRVIIGSQPFVFMAMTDLPSSVFVAKSMRSVNDQTLALIRAAGHEIVAWDEEALVRFDSPEYYPWRYSPRTFACISHLFCWGRNDAEFFAAYPGYRGAPIHVTGNPRLDLLRPELRGYFDRAAARLREKHGRFVLINTNFSFVNNYLKSLNLVRTKTDGTPIGLSRTGRGFTLAFAAGMAAHQRAILESFCDLLPRLSQAFPQSRFILRPHPSENHAMWRQVAAGLPNVEVIHDGNVVPWLIACQGLLHNGCTTAVEAAVLGTPAIAFQPVRAREFDYRLPNLLSYCGETSAEVVALTRRLLAGELQHTATAETNPALRDHLASTSGPLAVDRILAVLCELGYLNQRQVAGTRVSRAIGRVGLRGRAGIQRLKMRLPGHRQNFAHHQHQFPALEVAELNDRIARLGGHLNRFENVRASAVSSNIFKIAAESTGENRTD